MKFQYLTSFNLLDWGFDDQSDQLEKSFQFAELRAGSMMVFKHFVKLTYGAYISSQMTSTFIWLAIRPAIGD